MNTDNIELLTHSSIRITGDIVIYVDPFQITEERHDADLIFVTHDHFDHFSAEDIAKVAKGSTKLIVPKNMEDKAKGIPCATLITVAPNEKTEVDGIPVETVPAYNKLKPFHPKKSGWVGYILTVSDTRIYIAGDTDMTEEAGQVSCDVAMVPIGGKFTMNAKQAAALVEKICPKLAIPTHYGNVTGSKSDEEEFLANVKTVSVEIRMSY